ncbi:hypothetical protein [Palleronia salina]|nr:hypothetical protein [Palleronia salina]
MGNPQHYSIELPSRCLDLINGLWSAASNLYGGAHPDLGPLTSTFLVSMSMPILNIPLERIERQIDKNDGEAYADDRHLNPEAVEAFMKVIRKGKLGDAPFYKDGTWRFHPLRDGPFPNISDGLPDSLAEALESEDAIKAARVMPASQWVSLLRNAMAHGGIAYLDENGRSRHGTPVKMFAFVSGKYGKPKCEFADAACRFGMGKLDGLNFLRISEDDYRSFLGDWVAWLVASKIAKQAAA